MKSKIWTLAAGLSALATPAFAAAGDKGSPAVWIALGAVFMGVFTTLIAVLVTVNAKKKKDPLGE